MISHPEKNDIVVRERHANPSVVYVLERPFGPDHMRCSTREEAIATAVALARQQRVRAWYETGADCFVLLGTFRLDAADVERSPESQAGW